MLKSYIMRPTVQWLVRLVVVLTISSAIGQPRTDASAFHLADYDAELRKPDGRVDTEAMVGRLKELGVTKYYWLVWHAPTDWDDLRTFLPKAA